MSVEKRLVRDEDLVQPWALDKAVRKSSPKLSLEDTATGGATRKIASTAGAAKILDGADAEVMNIEAHKSRHVSGGADALTDADLDGIVGFDLGAHATRHASGGADAIGGGALRFAQIGKELGSGSSVSVGASGTYTVPAGVHLVFLGANTRVEAYDDVATAWKTSIAAGGAGLVISDGTNVRLYNAGSASEDSNIRSFA